MKPPDHSLWNAAQEKSMLINMVAMPYVISIAKLPELAKSQ